MEPQPGITQIVNAGGAGNRRAPAHSQQPLGREAADLLADVPLFAGLSRRHLGKVAGVASGRRFASYSTLVRVGAPADAFYVILDGHARVEVPGRPIDLRTGDFFGEMALIDGEPRSATVTAVDEVWAMMIPRAKFLKLLESEPKIAHGIMVTLTRRLRDRQAAATL